MGLSRSTYYDVPSLPTDDTALVATIVAICNEFEAYGYRRVGAELRHRGIVVNSKKIRRLMRENDLQPKPIAACWQTMVRWGGAGTPTTMPRQRVL